MDWIQILFVHRLLLWCFLIPFVTHTELIQCPQGLDLAFMIDANQSISDFDFERQKDFVKRVVKTLIEKRIRLNAAAVSYSDDAFVSLTLNFSQTFSVNSFNFIIDRLRRLPDKTLASKALQFTKDHVLKPALSGPTSHTPKIAFGVTTRKNLGETFQLSIGRSSIRRNRSFQIFNISLPSGAYISSFYMELFLNHLISAIDDPEIQIVADGGFRFAGRKYRLDCIASGSYGITIRWLINNIDMKNGTMNESIYLVKWENYPWNPSKVNLSLIFNELDLRHSANFTCEASNRISTKRCEIVISVSCPPPIPVIITLLPERGQQGVVTLRCEAHRLDAHLIYSYQWKWKFQDRPINEDEKYKIFQSNSSHNSCRQTKSFAVLQISKISKHDIGQYKCWLQKSGIMLAGKDVFLSGFGPPLQIANFSKRGLGRYRCELFSNMTKGGIMKLAEKYIPLSNNTSSKVPLRPKIVKLTAINCGSAIKVDWNPPPNESNITGYQIKVVSPCTGSKQVFHLTRDFRSRQIAVISNTDYEVNIRAKNSEGFSPWSKQKLITKADVPVALNFTAIPYGCSIRLLWKTLPDTSCPITRYTVLYRESMTSASNQRIWLNKSLDKPNATYYRLHLDCNKNYEVLVVAWNERGSSFVEEKSVLTVFTEEVQRKAMIEMDTFKTKNEHYERSTLRVYCINRCDRLCSIYFEKNGENISPADEPRVSISTEKLKEEERIVLMVTNVTVDDSGNYGCGIEMDPTEFGSINITVKYIPPNTPLITSIEHQCGRIEVTWNQSSTEAAEVPVTGFHPQIRRKDGDWRNCNIFPSNQSCLFKGQESETDYDIRVQAFNNKTTSDWTNEATTTGFIGPPDSPWILNNNTEFSGRTVTVWWTRPPKRNCKTTMYSLHYRVIKPTTKDLTEVNITDANTTSHQLHLRHSKKYRVTVFAWNDLGRSKESRPWYTGTAQYVPYPPILQSNFTRGCSSINVTWSPPAREALGGLITGYLAQIRKARSEEPWSNCTAFDNSLSTNCLFKHLKPNAKYDVQVIAKNKLGYGWPSEILEASTNQAEIPDRSDIKEARQQGCNVILEWTKSLSRGCPILFYTIYYRSTRGSIREWTEVKVENPKVPQRTLTLKCNTAYQFKVTASNELGTSHFSSAWSATTGRETTPKVSGVLPDEGSSLASILKVACIIFGSALVVFLFFIGAKFYRKKKQRRTKRTSKDFQVLDHCEIPPIRTEFIEELGEGAFGKVHKAKLKDGMEFFETEQDRVFKTKRKENIVAVKELHDNASEGEKREFMAEIELMKEVGKHQNVLSFLGCWTTTKPLLLVIEYIAHGDLLHWIRRKRSQINGSALGVAVVSAQEKKELYAGTKERNSASDQDGETTETEAKMLLEPVGPSSALDVTEDDEAAFDDNAECTIPMVLFSPSNQEEDVPTEKTDDECNDDCESFKPADLLTFAWQIARGMSYLSERGLVHRDLAARNILVGHGKRLKIADFGLMRQLYHEVYEVQKQKKLPIKWMAPESLYDQIFTSKSDVWSYGIVMWEIGTLGGSPYPLLGYKELMRLLKTNYRMEKPELCTEEFYSLMMECWKQNPDERPSFQQLVGRLEQLMLQDVEYFDFNQVDETKDYYRVQESKTGEITGESRIEQ